MVVHATPWNLRVGRSCARSSGCVIRLVVAAAVDTLFRHAEHLLAPPRRLLLHLWHGRPRPLPPCYVVSLDSD